MRARLFARFGPEAGLDVEVAGEATIGRGKDSTVPLSSPEVSQQHARIFFDEPSAAWWVEDLGSLNGTRLDGEPVTGRERLGGLHVLSFGSSAELFFVGLDPEPPAESAAAAERAAAAAPESGTRVDAEPPPLPPGLGRPPDREGTRIDSQAPILPAGLRDQPAAPAAAGRAATRVEQAPADLPPVLAGREAPPAQAVPVFALELRDSPGERFELVEGDNLVGRSRAARIVLVHRELSRRHARLRVAAGRVWLRDEGSRNHTYVGDEEVSDEVEIVPGSELRFGRLRARLVVAAEAGDAAPAAGPPDGEPG